MKFRVMKILFVFPNDYLMNGVPAGISVLSAVLKQKGHKISVFDFTFIKTKPLKSRADYVKVNFLSSEATCLATGYTLEDLVQNDPVESLEDKFIERLKDFQPDLIAMSSTSGSFGLGIDLLTKCKTHIKCKVLTGGVHASCDPRDALSYDIIDFVCIGEGEEFMVELCECLSQNKDYRQIKNLGYKTEGGIKINELRPFVDLDSLPPPDWSIFDTRHLFRPFMGNVYKGSFYTLSRGCPYGCPYCVNGTLRSVLNGCGKYYRFAKPSTVIKHLSTLKELYGATWFKFADNSLMSMTEEYLEELAKGLISLGINFACSIRPETATERKIELLKKMGCVAMSIGVESGNQQLRRELLCRNTTDEQIESAVNMMNKQGIRVSTFNMIGLPGETRENVFETIKLNKKLSVAAANVYILYPYPGTEIARRYNVNFRDKDGKIIHEDRSSVFAFSKMPPEEVEGLLKTFNLYLVLPEELWPVVRYAEKNDRLGTEIFGALTKYGSLLLNEKQKITSDMRDDI